MKKERRLKRCVHGIHDRNAVIKMNIASEWIALWVRSALHTHRCAIDKCMKAATAEFCSSPGNDRSCNRIAIAKPACRVACLRSSFLQLRTHTTRPIFIAVEDHHLRALIR